MRALHIPTRWIAAGIALGVSLALASGPLGLAAAGAQGTLAGYTASTLAVGGQFTFNIPNVFPLPGENLLEDDMPFARTNVDGGPIVNAIASPYYPGDIAAQLGNLLLEDGFPPQQMCPLFTGLQQPCQVPNDTAVAEAEYPTSPSYGEHSTFGQAGAGVAYASANASSTGGDATGTVTNLTTDSMGGSGSSKVLELGKISATDNVTLGASTIADSATTTLSSIDIAGMIDIAGLTSTAAATSDGIKGTPKGTLHLGQVTVDGQPAYIDNKGVHVASTDTTSSGVTPAQLQQTVNSTLRQDGITIQLLNPQLSSDAGAAASDGGGLQISVTHQVDFPYVNGEPTVPIGTPCSPPVPQPLQCQGLGNQGLPAGLYNVTTAVTLGLAQAAVSATTVASDAFPSVPSLSTLASPFGPSSFGGGSGLGSFSPSSLGPVQTVPATGPGAAAAPTTVSSSATDFPIRGVPAPIGWAVASLLGCLILCYPLLLVARWQFLNPRRR
jgi:hypothetical protein